MRLLQVLAIAALIVGVTSVASPRGVGAAASRRRAVAKKDTAKDRADSFQRFCADWMQKVWTREQQPAKWEPEADGVKREYVEYSRDYSCQLTHGSPPVGKINYRETWYEQHGKTIAEAEASPAQPVKILETGEFFSYSRGKWDY